MFKGLIAQGLGPGPTLCSALHLQKLLRNWVAMPSYWAVGFLNKPNTLCFFNIAVALGFLFQS
jgi:hypothetical protein